MDAVYPSDLTDAEWEVREPMMPKRKTSRRRSREVRFRALSMVSSYLNEEGYQWRAMPKELDLWQPIYLYFRLWNPKGLGK